MRWHFDIYERYTGRVIARRLPLACIENSTDLEHAKRHIQLLNELDSGMRKFRLYNEEDRRQREFDLSK